MSARRSRADVDLDRLPEMSLAELRALWTGHMGRARPPTQPRLMVRELAWRVQEARHGGLDAQTRRLLSAAVRAVQRDHNEGRQAPRRAKPSIGALPPTSRLVRVWKGVAHGVEVLEGGRSFLYRGERYGSLSEIARMITGTNWSGPYFFGLTTRSMRPSAGPLPMRRRGRP